MSKHYTPNQIHAIAQVVSRCARVRTEIPATERDTFADTLAAPIMPADEARAIIAAAAGKRGRPSMSVLVAKAALRGERYSDPRAGKSAAADSMIVPTVTETERMEALADSAHKLAVLAGRCERRGADELLDAVASRSAQVLDMLRAVNPAFYAQWNASRDHEDGEHRTGEADAIRNSDGTHWHSNPRDGEGSARYRIAQAMHAVGSQGHSKDMHKARSIAGAAHSIDEDAMAQAQADMADAGW